MNSTTRKVRTTPTAGRPGALAAAAITGLLRIKAVTLAGLAGLRDFLVALAETRPREEMLKLAALYASSDPVLAARLRAGARSAWPE